MIDRLKRLFGHLEWADRTVLDAFTMSPPPPKALELFGHILGAEHAWLTRLKQEPPQFTVWPGFDLAQCVSIADQNIEGFREYLATLTPALLQTDVPYVNSAGQSFRSRVDDILLHVALHGSYHRGQIALLVRGAGNKPAPTDFIAFARGVPAATRQG